MEARRRASQNRADADAAAERADSHGSASTAFPAASDARDGACSPAPAVQGRAAAAGAPARRRGARRGRPRAMPLSDWNSLPSYLKDNEYIKRYYRVDQSLSQTLASLFTLHNETGNVWTHLVGAVIFVVLTVATIAAHPTPVRLAGAQLAALEGRLAHTAADIWQAGKRVETSLRGAGGQIEEQLGAARQQLEAALAAGRRGGASVLRELESRAVACGAGRLHGLLAWEEWLLQHKMRSPRGLEAAISRGFSSVVDLQWPTPRWPVHVFTAGAMVCLATSTSCHLFSSASGSFAKTIWRYDYAGIVVLIVASFVPVIHYTFLCSPGPRRFYLVTSALLGAATLTVTLATKFQAARFRPFRAALFAGLGLWGIVPALHGVLLFGSSAHLQRALLLDALMGATYLGGAAIFAARIPERWRPGAFDLVFNSHQLFHCAVVAAALCHYGAVRVLLGWRDSTGGCSLPFPQQLAANASRS